MITFDDPKPRKKIDLGFLKGLAHSYVTSTSSVQAPDEVSVIEDLFELLFELGLLHTEALSGLPDEWMCKIKNDATAEEGDRG